MKRTLLIPREPQAHVLLMARCFRQTNESVLTLELQFRKWEDALTRAQALNALLLAPPHAGLEAKARHLLHADDPSPDTSRRLRYALSGGTGALTEAAKRMEEAGILNARERQEMEENIAQLERDMRNLQDAPPPSPPLPHASPVIEELALPDGAERIDVYVDGSWRDSVGGISGGFGSGGWGAVVVDSAKPGEPRLLAGPVIAGQKGSHRAECEGIINSLRDIREAEFSRAPRPAIVLHTDQKDLIEYLQAQKKGVTGRVNFQSGRERPHIHEISALAREMDLHFVYQQDVNTGPPGQVQPFRVAHRLAAWVARGGLDTLRGQAPQEGEESREAQLAAAIRPHDMSALKIISHEQGRDR